MDNRINKVILAIVAFFALFPLGYMVYSSFVDDPGRLERGFGLGHYSDIFSRSLIWRWGWNSFVVAFVTGILQTVISAAAAFSAVRSSLRLSRLFIHLMVLFMAVPGQLMVIFLYLEMVEFQLLDTLAAVILPGLSAPFGIFFLYKSLSSVPEDYFSSAEIDGAGPLRQFYHIVIPLMKPALMTLFLFVFTGYWNAFFWPLLVLNNPENYTISVGLATLQQQHLTDYGLLMAAGVLATLPIILIFLITEKYFEKGMMASGLK